MKLKPWSIGNPSLALCFEKQCSETHTYPDACVHRELAQLLLELTAELGLRKETAHGDSDISAGRVH